MEKQPSPISAIGVPTKLIDLPEPGPEGVISILIRKRHPAALLAAAGHLQSLAGETPKDVAGTLKMITESADPLRRIAEEGIIAPPFSFGEQPEDGKAWWGDLSFENQAAIATSIMELAGLSMRITEGTDAEAARAVSRFHGDSRGKAVRKSPRRARGATR